MNSPEKCDVAVVGGGPAGSIAAACLARSGYKVVLLEKQRHPRMTVGESLIPDFWKYCDEAGVTQKILDDGFIRKAGGTVDWHGTTRQLAFKDFGYTRPALHVERDRFDHILLQHARECGADVREDTAVQEVDLGGHGGPRLSFRRVDDSAAGQLTCRYVVDASGQAALLGRQLGLREMDEAFKFMSIWGYFDDSKYYGADGNIHPAKTCRETPPTTYVTSVPNTGDWGWCWHIMLRDCTSVGLVVPVDAMKSVKGGQLAWDRFLLQKCQSIPRLWDLLAGARLREGSVRVIRDFSYRSREVAGQGYFVVGDAAGFVDPIFSVGVVLGMYTARAAAWGIDRIFKHPETTARQQAIYSSQVQDRMEMARTVALPQYELDGPASHKARQVMQFSDTHARALLRAASALTARAQHFDALTQPADAGTESSGTASRRRAAE